MNFWKNLPRPFYVMAPLANVTDASFRELFAKYGKPDVTWTEFVSADGLFLGGYDSLIKDLQFSEKERPIVAQFFSPNPDLMEKAADLAISLGFDGIDINMGCPEHNVCKQGSGAALIKTPQKAREIIRATKRGAGNLPVSVKTRIGFNTVELETWMTHILEEDPALLTLHLRTRKEMSQVPAHWELAHEAVEIRNKINPNVVLAGNGDVVSLHDAHTRAIQSGMDGIMIGRGMFGTPWFFANKELFRGYEAVGPEDKSFPEISTKQKLNILIEHTKLFDQIFEGKKNFSIMKKHFKAYVNGFDGAKELRQQLMDQADDVGGVEKIVTNFLSA